MTSMFLLFFVWSRFVGRAYGDQYMDLVSIQVCQIDFEYDHDLGDEFIGNYSKAYSTPLTEPDTVSFTSGSNTFEFDRPQKAFQFKHYDNTYGNVYVRLKEESKMRGLFRKSYTDNCDCNNPIVVNNIQWETTVDSGNPGRPINVELCGTYDYVDGATIPDTSGLIKADLWDCDNNTCNSTTKNDLTIKYQGFEVFTDDNCLNGRRKLRSQNGDWRCERCNRGQNNDGWFSFQVGNEYSPPSGQGQNKCNNCKATFGDSCLRCDKHQGCASCTFDAFNLGGYEIISKGDDGCPWQYCGKPCCKTKNVIPAENCDDQFQYKEITSEHGSTNYICDDDAGRAANSEFYGEDKRYTLPLPISSPAGACSGDFTNCIGDCNNGLPYLCPNADTNCAKCNDVQPHNLRGCDICACSQKYNNSDPNNDQYFNCNSIDDEYFWYSNAVQCAPCNKFKNCTSCQDGNEHGGGGCAPDSCDPGYTRRYDDDVGVYFCAENVNDGLAEQPAVPGIDGWEGLTCLVQSDYRAGRHEYAFCGCNCTNCELHNIPQGTVPENPYCNSCMYHSGCGQCFMNNLDSSQDYFMQSLNHTCVNCRDTFGERCMDCGFEVGCQQCQDGYELTWSTCCELWYCEYISRFV